MSALESHLANGNITNIFAPVADTFLDTNDQFLGDPLERLKRGEINRRISYMMGENEEDGAEILYFLRPTLDKFRSTRELKYFIDNTMLPVSLQKYDQLVRSPFIQQLLAFQYFTSSSQPFETINSFRAHFVEPFADIDTRLDCSTAGGEGSRSSSDIWSGPTSSLNGIIPRLENRWRF